MTMKKLIFILAAGIIFSACSDEKVVENSENSTENIIVEVHPNQMLTMEIDGMVCKMGCGGSIRKGLKETNGVATVDFDFEEERKTNIAKITYDKSIVSSEELIKIVSKLNDGQFLVGTVSFEDYTAPAKATKTSATKKHTEEKTNVEVSESYVKLPNLFDLFSGLLR